jgi:hypothetical protein
MPAPQTVIQAAVARLSARLGSGLLDAAAQAAVVLQDAPERLRQEFTLFWQEVEMEAERLERGETPGGGAASGPAAVPGSAQDLQGQIDALRAQVASFSRRLDQQTP